MAAPRRLPLLASPGTAGRPGTELLAVPPAATDGPRPSYFVETWGCQMNVYDSERFGGQLSDLGYGRAERAEDADLILLNTCSVREQAEDKLYSRLGRLRPLKQQRPGMVIGVTGCVAQQEREAILARSPIVSFVLGTGAVANLGRAIAGVTAGERPVDTSLDPRRVDLDELRPLERSSDVRAYVTVIEGCDKSCSFCIVPQTRGPELSRPPASIVAEMSAAIAAGQVEVELLGQNVNAYRHGDTDFADLLRLAGRVEGLARLRFRTSHPREFTDRVIEAMAEVEPLCPHLHLPVQSGADSMLKRMARGYDRARYLRRIEALRRRLPEVAISTDIIVGFPGETDQEFADTLSLVAGVGFDQVYGFVYSSRPGTRAAELDDLEPRESKIEKLARLFELQDAISRRKHEALVGREMEVLVEGQARSGEGLMAGRTPCNRVLNFPAHGARVGQRLRVRVTRAYDHSLGGEPILASPSSQAETEIACPSK